MALSRMTLVALAMVLLLPLLTSSCTFLPVKTPREGSTIVHVSPPDSRLRLTLYLPDTRWKSLVKVEKEIVLRGERPYIAALREMLESSTDDRTSRPFPEGTLVVSEPQIQQGVLYINFSKQVQNLRPASEAIENLLLEALVRTLTEHREVTAVQILVDGQKVSTLAGNASILGPLTRAQFEKKKS